MAKLDELVVELTAETSRLRTELKNAVSVTEKASADMQSAIKEFSESSSKDVNFFETAMATMAGFLGSQAVLGVFSEVKSAVSFLTGELIEGAKGAMEEEQSLRRLANSLALIGNYSESSAKDMEDFVDAEAKMTAKTGEAVADTVSLLAVMTKLDNEGLKKATKAALDLSAAYGIDLEGATRLIGKGIEGNTEAFKKFGIQIQEGGSKAQNLENILKGLQVTQGAAAGAAKTFGGQVFALQEGYEDLFKAGGYLVTQNEVINAMMAELTQIFRELTDEVNSAGSTLKKDVAEVLIMLTELAGTATLAVDYLIRTTVGAYKLLETAINAVLETGKEFIQFITQTDDGKEAFAGTKESFKDLQDAFTEDTTLGKVAEGLARISSVGRDAMATMSTETDKATEATVRQGQAIAEITAVEQARLDQLKTFATGLAEQTTAFDSYYQFQLETLQANLEMELITQEEFFTTKLEMIAAQTEAENALLDEARTKNLVSEQQYQAAQLALVQKQATANKGVKKEQMDYEKLTDKQRQENMKSTFAAIATLSESSNKELAAIGKAAAITTATIDGFAAVQKALASAPPPFNFALAALVGVATAANVAKIAGVGLKGGIDEVPGIGNQDNFPAVLAPGERVVPSQTNKDLKEFLARNKSGQMARQVNLSITISNNLPASREAGNAMIEAINEALRNGSLRIDQAV